MRKMIWKQKIKYGSREEKYDAPLDLHFSRSKGVLQSYREFMN